MSDKKIIILTPEISGQIKTAISRSGKTLDEIKSGTGISKAKLSRIQNGKMVFIDENVIEKLSKYLGISIYIPGNNNEKVLYEKIMELEKENRNLRELLMDYLSHNLSP